MTRILKRGTTESKLHCMFYSFAAMRYTGMKTSFTLLVVLFAAFLGVANGQRNRVVAEPPTVAPTVAPFVNPSSLQAIISIAVSLISRILAP